MKQVIYLFIGCVSGLFLASCAHSDLGGDTPDGGAVSRVAFSAQIDPKLQVSFASDQAKDVDLSQLIVPKASDFRVSIVQGSDTVLASNAAELPTQLELAVGAYSIEAVGGPQGAVSWNAPYFVGRSAFNLSASTTSVAQHLVCRLGSALVQVVFDESFSSSFDQFSATLATEHTDTALVWQASETRVACFRPASQLLIRVSATLRSSGKVYHYGIDPAQVGALEVGELSVVCFSVDRGKVSATVTADNGVTVRKKTAEMDPNWLTKYRTTMVSTLPSGTLIDHIYGLPFVKGLDAVVRTNVGVKSLWLKLDAAYAAQLGVDSLDLLAPASAGVLQNLGVAVTSNAAVAGVQEYRVNLKGSINKLKVRGGAVTDYGFTVAATDLDNSYASYSLEVQVTPPQFRRSAQNEQKIYGKFAYIPAAETTNVPDADKSRFPLEYWIKKDSDTEWRSLGVIAGTEDIYVSGLEAGATYLSKAMFEDMEFGQATFVSRSEEQIPNGNFDDCTPWGTYAGRSAAQGADFKGWASLNLYTTLNQTSANFFQSYPCVDQVAGRSGKAAEMTVVGWGGNAVYQCKRYTEWFQAKYEWTRTKDRTTAGKIFLGAYNYNDESEEAGAVHGIALPNLARPKAFSFWYKYAVVAGTEMIAHIEILSVDDQVLGTAEYRSVEAKSDFSHVEVPITYDANTLFTTAAKVKLYFSAKSTPAVQGDVNQYDGSGPSKNGTFTMAGARWYGSSLTVDDVQLVYPDQITDFQIR